jgi:hypothetical protein
MVLNLADDEDIYNLISEGDRVRLCYQILQRLKLSELSLTDEVFDKTKYARFDHNEQFLDFLKRHDIYKDLTPLHSRSRVVMKMLDYKVNGEDESYDPSNSLTKIAMKHWLMPVPPIRQYYGEDIGIYFEWMNYFLKWMFVPGIAGLVIWILNQFFSEDSAKSPLNALFSIGMAFWGALFSI